MALGVFSFCIIGIVFLLATGLDSSRSTQRDSALAAIIQSMDAEVRTMRYSGSNSLSTLVPTTNFYFEAAGNRLPSATGATFRVSLNRLPATVVSDLTKVENGSNTSPGIANTTMNYLWRLNIAYPGPNFQESKSALLGRTLYGSGSWTKGAVTYSFYE